ncbi:MAG TPA: hypothetical protein VFW07_06920 [Parafilimonas sp.]|nr:hypothetical protein [Parafilimonas sp.]
MAELTAHDRQWLHKFIDEADEEMISRIIAFANGNIHTFELTEEELKEMNEEDAAYDRGGLKTYKWEDIKDMATGKKKMDEL